MTDTRCEPPYIMVSLNDYVRVKLTQKAREHFGKIRADLNRSLPNGARYFSTVPKEDEHGWYKDQLWCLLKDFGDMIEVGRLMPFEGGIAIPVATPAEVDTLRAEIADWRAVNLALGIDYGQPADIAALNVELLRRHRDDARAEVARLLSDMKRFRAALARIERERERIPMDVWQIAYSALAKEAGDAT